MISLKIREGIVRIKSGKIDLKGIACMGLSLLMFVALCAGCAGSHKTTKTTITKTTVANPVGEGNKGYLRSTMTVGPVDEQQTTPVTQESNTTATTTETKSSNPGILSSTVHAIGWVIALPFRLIGGLIGWIF